MTFSLSVFLIPYLLFLLLWLAFSLVAVYHMMKFGFKNFTTFFTTFIYIGVSIIILVISYNFLSQINWGINMSVLEGLFNSRIPF